MKPAIVSVFVLLSCSCGQKDPIQVDAPPPAQEQGVPLTQHVLTAHVFVALCDNDSQGIVPVPAALGNGDDTGSNLYWGAMYGVRAFFKRSEAWKLVAENRNPTDGILERVVFKSTRDGGYLVADAYRGSKIRKAVVDFLNAAAGNDGGAYACGDDILGLNGHADLVAYAGHNGLMDFTIPAIKRNAEMTGARAAIVLACKSRPYFESRLSTAGCTSLLLTTGFMAPEAYTLEAAINAWIQNKSPGAVHEQAAAAYHRYQKCGIDGARRLFYTPDTARNAND